MMLCLDNAFDWMEFALNNHYELTNASNMSDFEQMKLWLNNTMRKQYLDKTSHLITKIVNK